MRIQAIRASETLYKAGDRTFDADYRALATDKDTNVAIQAMLTLNYLKAPNVAETVRAAQAASTARGVQEIGNQILKPPTSAFGRGGRGRAAALLARRARRHGAGRGDLQGSLLRLPRGRRPRDRAAGAPAGTTMAPSLANSTRVQGHRDYVIKTLLHGMDGPIEGRSYAAGVMAPMGTNKRRVDCGDRVLRAQLLRQRRLVRLAGRRGAGPGRDRGSQVVLESRRAPGVAPDAARGAADVEGDARATTPARRSAR